MTDIDTDLAVALLADKHIQGAAAFVLASQPEGPLRGVQVPPRLAFAAWTVLREAVPRTGAWPIVIGNHPRLPQLEGSPPSLEGILAEASGIDLEAWATKEIAAHPARFQVASAPWPATVQHLNAFQLLGALGKESAPVVIALVPTVQPHEVPAYLRFGGGNACPPPEVHVAVLRAWHDRFGAEPVVMTNDTLELLVRKPVATQQQALALAAFQYVYCSDIVDQGAHSVEALAATLLGDPRWFFWWH
jgi:hypothetical protein